MLAVEAKLAEDEELTDKEAQRVVAAKKGEESTKPLDVDAIEKMDAGIDQLVQGCKILMSASDELKRANLEPNQRKSVDKINDLTNNAIGPYLVEIIEASQEFEE
jgi:hypothetical protein